jgi:hypothetical protein
MFPECSLNVPWMFPECSLKLFLRGCVSIWRYTIPLGWGG